jgi:hypothetical protein
MSRTKKGWSLHFADLTRKLKGKAFVQMSRSVPFTQGEWIQEDPTSSTNTSQDIPYPQLSTLTFDHLMVNGVAPALNLRDGQVLISSGGSINVPTPVVNDAFSLRAPSGAALQYLDDEQHLDAALNQFDVDLATWHTTAASKQSSEAASFSDAVASDADDLASQKWPTTSRKAIADLIQSDRLQLKNLTSWKKDQFNTRAASFATFQLERIRNDSLTDNLRATLNLPPL